MSAAVKIRRARNGEMPAIRALIGEYPDTLVQSDLPGIRSFFVAESGGRLIGCCALEVYSPRLAELRSLAVRPEFVQQGVGRMLVEACKKRAREREVKQVLAVSSAVGFFEKAGFSTFKKEKIAFFFDPAGEDALAKPTE